MKLKFLAALALAILASSCNALFLKIYGLSNNTQMYNDEEIIQFAEKYKIFKTDVYQLDTAYCELISSLRDTTAMHDHNQPFQAIYFGRSGKIEAFFINCYADGFPNLRWNANRDFDVFPPTQQQGLTIDTLVDYSKIKPYIRPLFESQISDDDVDYFVVVFWPKAGGRQSKRLIKQVQENLKLAKGSVKVMFVNNDNYLVFSDKEQ